MKQLLAMALVCAVAPAMAVKFNDVSGDVNAPMTTYGNPNVDILGLEIVTDLDTNNNNEPRVTFTFTTVGPDMQNPNWIKLVMAIHGPDTGSGYNTGLSTGWPRLFNIAGGSNRWIGGWVDGAFGGFEARIWNGTDFGGGTPAGATWLGTPGMISMISGNTATYQVYLSTLGLQLGARRLNWQHKTDIFLRPNCRTPCQCCAENDDDHSRNDRQDRREAIQEAHTVEETAAVDHE